MSHGELVRAVLVTVSPLGMAWANNTGALRNAEGRLVRYGLKGSADVLACVRTRMVAIEVKVGRDTQSKEQRSFASALTSAGGLYIVARSVDDVTAALRLEGLL